MEDVTREVLESIAKMQQEMEKAFREIWTKFSKVPAVEYGTFEPAADIEDRGNELVIYVDVPGFDKNEIRIKVTEDSVEIRAEKSEERRQADRQRNYIVKQRVYESLYKRIVLPVKVRPEQARAKLVNGVLEIYIPKSEAAREIELPVE